MALRICFPALLLFTLAAAAADRDLLRKRVQQYRRALRRVQAELLQEDQSLRELHRDLKAREHELYRRLQKHPRITAIAADRAKDPVAYQRQYTHIRLELLQTDADLRAVDEEITRLTQRLARALARQPKVALIHKRLDQAEAKLTAETP